MQARRLNPPEDVWRSRQCCIAGVALTGLRDAYVAMVASRGPAAGRRVASSGGLREYLIAYCDSLDRRDPKDVQ